MVSTKEGKHALHESDKIGIMHHDAFKLVAEAAKKDAEKGQKEAAKQAAAAAKKAAEEEAARKAAAAAKQKAAEEEAAAKAAAKKAAEDEAAAEAAKKAAEAEAAAKAAAKKAAEEEAAAKKAAEEAAATAAEAKKAAEEAAKKAEAKAQKALEGFCGPATKYIPPPTSPRGPPARNITIRNQCFGEPGDVIKGEYFWVNREDLGPYASITGMGEITANLYKGNTRCWSTTVEISTHIQDSYAKYCQEGQFECAAKFSLYQRGRYCKETPWGDTCGTCTSAGGPAILLQIADNTHKYAAPGDTLEIFATKDGPCQPGWNGHPCPQ